MKFLLFSIWCLITTAAPVAERGHDILDGIDNALGLLSNLTLISNAIAQISTLLTDFQEDIAAVQNVTTTQNGLASMISNGTVAANGTVTKSVTNCTAMTLLFARGTTEPGNVGVLAGPPFISALVGMMPPGQVTIQGINYGANIRGFLNGGDADGTRLMASLTQQVLTACPTTKLVLSGYSQGGQLVHNAASMLPASTMAKVSSIVIFGDPDNGRSINGTSAAQTKIICHAGDNICEGGDAVLLPHLTYGMDSAAAAMFVAARSGLGMDSSMKANMSSVNAAEGKARLMGIGG